MHRLTGMFPGRIRKEVDEALLAFVDPQRPGLLAISDDLGAALAGASPGVTEALSAYGLPLGIAFQLRDDMLGVFGDPAATGKPAGDDLREGKRTVLIAATMKRASPAQASLVR